MRPPLAGYLFLLTFAAILPGCAFNATGPEAGARATPEDAQVVVTVEDETDKAYLSDIADPSSLYREIAAEIADGLSGGGVLATVFDAPDARRLVVHLRRVALTNNSSGNTLDVRLRTEVMAEMGDWRQSYDNEATIQRGVAGGVSPVVIRDVISEQVAAQVAGDPALLQAAQKR